MKDIKQTQSIFEFFVRKGYEVHNKRVLGNPLYTSEETKNKDLIQEYALIVEWLRVEHGIWILILPQDKSAVDFRIDKSKYPNHALFFSIIKYEEDFYFKELINTSDKKGELFLHFDSPQEAYQSAFDYIKDNELI